MSEIDRLKKEISNLESRYKWLAQTIINENEVQVGGDIRTVREETRRGSDEEISEISSKLNELRKKLEEAERRKVQEELSEPSRRLEEAKWAKRSEEIRLEEEKRNEVHRLNTFKQLKRAYKERKKKISKVDLFFDFIMGGSNRPNWKKISKFSQDELDYLFAVLNGKTKYYSDFDRIIDENKKYTSNEKKRIKAKKHFDGFKELVKKGEAGVKRRMDIDRSTSYGR